MPARVGSPPPLPFWKTWRSHLVAFDWARIGLSIGTVLVLSSLLSLHLIPDKVSLHVGERSNQEIRAARTVQYVDRTTTEEMREQAADRVEPDL